MPYSSSLCALTLSIVSSPITSGAGSEADPHFFSLFRIYCYLFPCSPCLHCFEDSVVTCVDEKLIQNGIFEVVHCTCTLKSIGKLGTQSQKPLGTSIPSGGAREGARGGKCPPKITFCPPILPPQFLIISVETISRGEPWV